MNEFWQQGVIGIGNLIYKNVEKQIGEIYENPAEKSLEKDDIITNINREKKETMKHPNPEKVKTTIIFESSPEQAKEIKKLCDNLISATEKDKTEKLVFTTLEKQLTSEKQQGHLSTRHKKPASMNRMVEDEIERQEIIKKLLKATNNFLTGFTTSTLMTSNNYSSGDIKIEGIHYYFAKYKNIVRVWDRPENYMAMVNGTEDYIFEFFICPNTGKVTKNLQTKIAEKGLKTKEYNIDLTQKEIDRASGIAMESLQRPIDANFSRTSYQECAKIGIKNNKNKPSLDIVINRQFPKALQLIALATEYGHNKYSEKDKMYDNFRNVEGGSQTYFDANARHSVDRNGIDESGLPHIVHAVWSSLAGLELWAEENSINIKEFSENYMKNLQSKD